MHLDFPFALRGAHRSGSFFLWDRVLGVACFGSSLKCALTEARGMRSSLARSSLARWSDLAVPSSSRCPLGRYTHRHGSRPLLAIILSASPGISFVNWTFSHRGPYSDRLYSLLVPATPAPAMSCFMSFMRKYWLEMSLEKIKID